MLNKIIKFSLHNRAVIALLAFFLTLWGVYITVNSDIDVFPDLNAPTVAVMTEAPGFTPEEVERSVTFPIETALNGATNIRRVRSTSSNGFSIVWAEFDWNTNIYQVRQIVAEKLSQVSSGLPEGIKQPIMGPQSSLLGEMLIVGLTAKSTSMLDLRTIADRNIAPRLLAVSGVSQVSVIGGDVEEFQIRLDSEKMKFHGVALQDVIEATQGINNNNGGGILYDYGNEYTIKGSISTNNLNEIACAVVKSDGMNPIILRDIASIEIGGKSPKLGLAAEKGQQAVLLTITKQPNIDTNRLTDNILKCLEDAKTTLPKDVVVSTDTYRQSDFINNSISNLQGTLIEGALFVILVLFVFLMDTRTTIISVLAIPISILTAIIVLHYMGATINTMTLGGIAIAIGSLVDDAIVDVENVYKRIIQNQQKSMADRMPLLEVIYRASAEVRMPIFNSTLIIIASFLPLFFLSGMEGKLLIPLGTAFVVSLLASTIVALTITPMLCSYLLKPKKDCISKESIVISKIKVIYSTALQWSFAHKKLLLGTVSACFIIAFALVFTLGRSFLPAFNEGSFTINVTALPGISLEESNKIGQEAEKILLSIPEIKTTSRKTGRAELAEHSFGANVSEIEAPYELNGRTKKELIREVRSALKELPGVGIEIGQPITHRIDHMLSGSKSAIAIKVFGDNLSNLYQIGNNIKSVISGIDGIVDVSVEQQVNSPQIRIIPKREIMAKYGVTIGQFKEIINVALSGLVVSQVYNEGLPYDLTLRFGKSEEMSVNVIKNLSVDTNIGKVPFSEIAEIISTDGPNSINRENVSRRILISANIQDRDLRGAVNEIKAEINDEIKLPENYYITYGGQFESEASATATLAVASLIALIIVLILLYYEYHNIVQSLIILVNLPLAMIGGIFVLRLTSGELNIPAIIGFISLLGICTRNGMLLISRYNNLTLQNVPLMQRILQGSTDRLAPIVMTALTSALALIPLAIKASEPGNEIQSPMAIVILGGLFTATLLNLFVVPVIYYLTHKNREK